MQISNSFYNKHFYKNAEVQKCQNLRKPVNTYANSIANSTQKYLKRFLIDPGKVVSYIFSFCFCLSMSGINDENGFNGFSQTVHLSSYK